MPIHFYIGMTAAVLTTAAFLPQVIKAHKSRHTGDLSLIMYLMFTAGVFLWIIYGFIFGELPIIIANSVTFLLSLYILFLKIRYG